MFLLFQDDFDYGDVAREFESLLNLYKDQASDEPHNPMILRIFKRSQNDDWSLNRLPRGILIMGLYIDKPCPQSPNPETQNPKPL